MKAGFSKHGIFGALAALNVIIAILFHFVIIPYSVPTNAGLTPETQSDMSLNITVAGFILSVLVAAFFVYLLFPLLTSDSRVQEVADAIRQPVLMLDNANRILMINSDGERVLGISRDRDFGKTIDSDISAALGGGKANNDTLNLRATIKRGDHNYQVIDNPVFFSSGAQDRQRLILLREVDGTVKVRDAIAHINQTMAILGANTQKISNSSQKVSNSATEQAGSLAAISTSLDEFSKKIQGNTDTAAKGNQLAAQAREAAERSGNEIAHALNAMTDVQDAGIRIARIVKLIDDIAFQTNLLALNAAVEAARAGRQGKGFAVVADEVRNLAGRSAKAAKDTAVMVEDVTERIGNASTYISKLEEMLRNIVQDAIRMADSSASASTTSAEQANAILQVNQELGQMSSVTNTTMSAAEQTATSVEILARQVDSLKNKVDILNSELGGARESRQPAGELLPQPSARQSGQEPSINLTASPPPFARHSSPGASFNASISPTSHFHFGDRDDSDDDFVAPFKKMAAAGSDWDLNAEASEPDNTLANLLRSDGYDKDYNDFLRESHKGTIPPYPSHDSLHGPTEFKTTADGDKVVKPGQNIHLDDSEFGRY